MKKTLSMILALLMLVSLLTACGGGQSSDGTDQPSAEGVNGVTYSLGSVAAETSVQIEAAKMFASKVNEYTNGAITINIFPASQLGSDESMCEDLSRGALEFAFLNQGSCAGFDQMLDCHYLPYIARDYDEADKLFYGDGIIPTTLTQTLNSHGINVIGWYENEFRGMSSYNEIKPAADVSGLKMRVPGSAAIKDYFTQLGAQCVTLTMGELYTELADMQVNSWIMVAVKADTDPEIISFLQDAFAPAAVSDAYKATQEGFFFQPVEEMSNEDMLNFVAAQHSYYESLLK